MKTINSADHYTIQVQNAISRQTISTLNFNQLPKNSKQRRIFGNKEIVWGKKQKEKESARTCETYSCIGVQWEANVQGSESNKTNKQRRLNC